MLILGCLSPYEHVCVSLSVRAYVSECIVRACKHVAFVYMHERVREGVCESLSDRPSVCLADRLQVRASKCLIVHACVHQCMRSCVCMHACVRYYVCVRSSVLPSVHLSVCLPVRMFVRPNVLFAICVRSSMDVRHLLFLTSNF